MSQPKKKDKDRIKRMRIQAILLGALLATICHVIPQEYQAACNVVAKLAALTCGGS